MKKSRSDVRAICADISYQDPCGADKIYNKDTKTCEEICRTNSDCTGGQYCDLITFTSDEGCYFETGLCRSVLDDRRDYSITFTDGENYITEDWIISPPI
ncbi:MAG: hypothetical protein J6Y85_02695 [Alphaproteobacteria bacterium]|nr:hypothetical protein [Alphaproteobacteria bacterium]